MRLSVIIPVYNSEKTLRAALSSLKRQRYGDFEVLCVNDGSTDGSAELIDAFVQAECGTSGSEGRIRHLPGCR